ncbi:MAG: type IV secretion system protein [Alphaproteobacteria bacterium]
MPTASTNNTVDKILQNLDAIIQNFVQGSFNSLSAPMETLWSSMFIIFIAFYGYKVIINGRFSPHDGIIHISKMLIVLVLITSWTDFQMVIMKVVTDTPADIAGQVIHGASGGSTNVGNLNTELGNFYESSMQVSSKIMKTGGNIFTRLSYSWAVWLATLALTAYALALIALSKIAVAVLLSVAPFFILMLIFAQTKTLFEGWLRTLLNYAFIPLFVYALLALLLSLSTQALTEMQANVSATSSLINFIAPFLLISVIAVMLLAQVMNIASGIAGGLSLQTMGLGKSIANKVGGGAKLAGGVGRIHADKALDKGFKTGAHAKNKSSDSAENANKVKAAAAKNREVKV